MKRGPGERPFNRLTVAAKQRRHQERMREPPVSCPDCETETTAGDLVSHLGRCEGPREPHPKSRWVTWREALELGAPRQSMSRWIRRGRVRMRTVPIPQRQYLLRDIALRIAESRARRRR